MNIIFSRLFIFFLLASSLLFADTGSIVCESVSDLTSVFPGKAFLTDSRRACFKSLDNNRMLSASSPLYFLPTFFSTAGKAGSAGVVFPGRPGDIWSHKSQFPAEPPFRASVLKTLLKNKLIPDGAFFGEANDRKRNRLEGALELTIANWQKLVKRPSYPAAVVSVSDASMRVVITRGDVFRSTSLASLYDELINIQTQSYLALLDTEALEEIAGSVTGGLTASDDGDDENDNTYYSSDPEPLIIVYNDREYPDQDSEEELIRKNLENKRRLLKILRKKMQQAIARGHGDLARILDNRIMLIEADLEHLNDLNTSSTGITENDQGSPGVLSFLKTSLLTDGRELQQRDDDALIQTLSQHSVNTDYQNFLIVPGELTDEAARFYDRWQNTTTGLVYQELRRRLEQQLQSGTEDIDESTQQTESLISGLETLSNQFREMFSANLPSRPYGRQVPNKDDEDHEQAETSSSAVSSKQKTSAGEVTHGKKSKSDYRKKDDEEEEPPNKDEHNYSTTVECPVCLGPCKEKEPEACVPVAGASGSTEGFARRAVLAENNVSALINHPDINTECPICLEPLDLAERHIKQTTCRHLVHGDCLDLQISVTGGNKLKCPSCNERTVSNSPFWNEATGSFVYPVYKSDLKKPEPFVAPPVRFADPEEVGIIDSTLAFKGAPMLAVRSDDPSAPIPPGIFNVNFCTDQGVCIAEVIRGTYRGDHPEIIMTLGAIVLSVAIMVQKIITGNIRDAMAKVMPAGWLNQKADILDVEVDVANGVCMIATPGVEIRSMTKLANTLSFLGNTLSFGYLCRRWFFQDLEFCCQFGKSITAVNLPKTNMNFIPSVPQNSLPDVASEAETFQSPQGLLEGEDYFFDGENLPWYERTKFSLKCSLKPGGEEPFAELSGITFKNKRDNAILLDSYSRDIFPEDDRRFKEYKENFFRGIESLDDKTPFYIHVRMDPN